jgi:hypothetical protein
MPKVTARIAANAIAALIAATFVGGVAWFAAGAAGPDRTWSDGLGIVTCVIGCVLAGYLAIPRRHR